MTELQYAHLVISLSTLGQIDLAGNDIEELRTLSHLLEAAASNVRIAISNRDTSSGELSDEPGRAFDTSGRDYEP
jgi:hypothetical protein